MIFSTFLGVIASTVALIHIQTQNTDFHNISHTLFWERVHQNNPLHTLGRKRILFFVKPKVWDTPQLVSYEFFVENWHT